MVAVEGRSETINGRVECYWADSKQTAVVVELSGRWTWSSYEDMRFSALHPMLDTASHLVHYIGDISQGNYFPKDTFRNIHRIAGGYHPNFSGLLVVVGATSYVQYFLTTVNILTLSRNLDVRLIFADTYAEALALVTSYPSPEYPSSLDQEMGGEWTYQPDIECPQCETHNVKATENYDGALIAEEYRGMTLIDVQCANCGYIDTIEFSVHLTQGR